MKHLFLIVNAILFFANATAQQKPHYTQYIQNQYILNPALSGIEMYADVKMSYRHQWVGFDDGPKTSYFTIQGPLGRIDEKHIPPTLRMPKDNSRGQEYWDNYKAGDAHHGWGVQIINDRTGPLSTNSAQLTYAYHLPLNDKYNLSAGVGAGASQMRLDPTKLRFATTVDPAVYGSNSINKIRPDFSVGIYLYGPSAFAGLSAQQIVPQKIEFDEVNNITRTVTGKAVPHLFAIAGFRTMLGEDINVVPSILVKKVWPAPVQIEANAKFLYRDVIWAGASYRHKDGVSAMLGMYIGNNLNIGYSYDYTTSGLQTYSKGTHEVIMGLYIKNQGGESCPRNVW